MFRAIRPCGGWSYRREADHRRTGGDHIKLTSGGLAQFNDPAPIKRSAVNNPNLDRLPVAFVGHLRTVGSYEQQ